MAKSPYVAVIELFGIPGAGTIALLVWLVIALSQLILQRRMGAAAKELELKMWLFPYLTWLSIAVITALLVGMVIVPETSEALLLSAGLVAIVVAIGVYRYRKGGGGPPADAVLGEELGNEVESRH